MNEEELNSLKYRDLQKLAKDHGIKANLSKAGLVSALVEVFEKNRDKSDPNSVMETDQEEKNMQDKSIRFEDFPAEILLKILNFLEINGLLKCSQTSRRIRVICYDESLWQTINLSKKKVPTEFLKKVVSHGCKSLNLNEATLVGTLKLKNESQFTHLDLSGCSAMSHVFEELLKSCQYLQKLTFTQPLNFNTLSAMTSQNGKTLQVLNCRFGLTVNVDCSAYNLSLPSIRPIIENCTLV